MKKLSKTDKNKPRSRRLRKKLKLGEFREDQFDLEMIIPYSNDNTFAKKIGEWNSFLELHGFLYIHCVAGKKLMSHLTGHSNRSLTEDDRELVEQWLSKREWVSNFEIGELKDAWHG